jgi:long-chain acyl-CoA synthetase
MNTRALPRTHATVVHMLADAAAREASAEALVCQNQRLSYAEYLACVCAFARELQAMGARGERVATLLENSIESCVAAFGILAAGAQHVPLNPLYTPRELAFILRDAAPLVLVLHEAVARAIEPVAREAGVRHCIVVGPGTARLEAWRAAAAALPDHRPAERRESHPSRHLDQRGATRGAVT